MLPTNFHILYAIEYYSTTNHISHCAEAAKIKLLDKLRITELQVYSSSVHKSQSFQFILIGPSIRVLYMPFFRASSAFDFLPIRGNWRLLTEQGTEHQV